MTREDMEHLAGFVLGIRNASIVLTDSCNLFLEYLASIQMDAPLDPSVDPSIPEMFQPFLRKTL